MTHYEASAILTIVSTGIIAIIFALKDSGRPVDRQYSIYLMAISAWAFCWFKMISSDFNASLFWARVLHVPAVFIPATFLHFSRTFLGLDDSRSKRLVQAFYAAAPLFIFPVFFRGYIETVVPREGFRYYVQHGPFYFAFISYFVICVVITFAILTTEFVKATGSRRKAIGFVLMAYTIGYAGGSSVFLPDFGLRIPQLALYGIPVGHLIILYAITRHQWMNVGLLARRAGVIAAIYAGLALGVAPFILTLHEGIDLNNGAMSANLALEVFLLSAALSAGPFIYLGIARRTMWLQDHQSKGLTHELKSPLYAIQSAVEIVREELRWSTSSSARTTEYLRMIDDNAARMSKVVANLLSVGRIDDGALVIRRDRVDLKSIVSELIDDSRPVSVKKGVLIDFACEGDCRVIGDEEKLRQVVSNLIGNAIKFTHGGTITVEIRRENDHIEFSIKDPGIGITSDELPQIFNRYYQGSSASRGSGIGLTIAKAWVEAHGGTIWAHSDGEGKGTIVRFKLEVN